VNSKQVRMLLGSGHVMRALAPHAQSTKQLSNSTCLIIIIIKYKYTHSILTAIFPGEPGLAGCPLNSPPFTYRYIIMNCQSLLQFFNFHTNTNSDLWSAAYKLSRVANKMTQQMLLPTMWRVDQRVHSSGDTQWIQQIRQLAHSLNSDHKTIILTISETAGTLLTDNKCLI